MTLSIEKRIAAINASLSNNHRKPWVHSVPLIDPRRVHIRTEWDQGMIPAHLDRRGKRVAQNGGCFIICVIQSIDRDGPFAQIIGTGVSRKSIKDKPNYNYGRKLAFDMAVRNYIENHRKAQLATSLRSAALQQATLGGGE